MSAIRARLDSGRWQRLYPGAYATYSGEPPRLAFIWGAVLSAGPGAVISHQTAAELYGFGRRAHHALNVAIPEGRHVHRTGRLTLGTPPLIAPGRSRLGAGHPGEWGDAL